MGVTPICTINKQGVKLPNVTSILFFPTTAAAAWVLAGRERLQGFLRQMCQPWESRLSEKSVTCAREAHLGEWNPRQY
ncbi:hypothetical protein Lal_00031817 [Lupinus albus]|nr:hypothetical protein Lal_00031817 [Lupinus albus]